MKNANLYSKDWKDIIRPEILKRDGYKCKKCQVKHKDVGYYDYKKNWISCDEFMIEYTRRIGFKIITIYLQVHHKNGNPSDNDNSNLISFCPRCHFNQERALNQLKKKLQKLKL